MVPTGDPWELATTAAAALRDRLGRPRAVLVLGSGWAGAADRLGHVVATFPSHELPGVPEPTVSGHEGVLRQVRTGPDRDDLLVVSGRSHLYEGHDAAAVVHLVRAAVMAGAATVVLTNAAGSLHPGTTPGEVVVLSDQLNLTGANPMTGPPPPASSPSRFVDLTALYDPALRAALLDRRPDLREGVYAGVLGGSFETPAEIRMLATVGADLVGMSTVLEAIAAHHLGARVLGLSLVTNLAAGLQDRVDHLEVLDVAAHATGALADLLAELATLL